MTPDPAPAAPGLSVTSDGLGTFTSATIRRRLAATLYEALLLAAVALLVGFATLPLVAPAPHTVSLNAPVPLPTSPARAISFASLFVVWGLYCAGSWANGRRTLPMRTWRLALVDARGGAPGWAAVMRRYLACWIGPACAIALYEGLREHGAGAWAALGLTVNYAWALADPQRQFLQDRLAGTRLVLRPSATNRP